MFRSLEIFVSGLDLREVHNDRTSSHCIEPCMHLYIFEIEIKFINIF